MGVLDEYVQEQGRVAALERAVKERDGYREALERIRAKGDPYVSDHTAQDMAAIAENALNPKVDEEAGP